MDTSTSTNDIFERFEELAVGDMGMWWDRFERDTGVKLTYIGKGLWIANECILLVERVY